MTVSRSLSLALILVCLLSAGSAAADVNDSEWLSMSAGEITVRHRTEDTQAAERILSVARESSVEIAREMGLDAFGPVTITIAATGEDFERETAGGAPDWGVGVASPRRGSVVIRSPRTVRYPLQMEQVVVHELAHVAVGRVLRGVWVPRWFHEGIAMAVAGEWRLGASQEVAAALAGGHLISLRDLRSSFPAGGRAAMLAYTESFYAVELIKRRSNASNSGELVRAIAEEGSFESALVELTGGDADDLEEALAAFVERRLGWSHLLLDGRVMFAGLAGLVLIAVVVRLRRSRKKMTEWAEAERAGREPGETTRWDWKH